MEGLIHQSFPLLTGAAMIGMQLDVGKSCLKEPRPEHVQYAVTVGSAGGQGEAGLQGDHPVHSGHRCRGRHWARVAAGLAESCRSKCA